MTAVQDQTIDRQIFQKYAGLSLPRHVSYPMPSSWSALSGDEARGMFEEHPESPTVRPLSLYLHIPFCEALCKFCACNKVIMRKDKPGASESVERYIRALKQEIQNAGGMCRGRTVQQIHWGGGSPSYLSATVIAEIMATIHAAFTVEDDSEIAMEIDPRHSPPSFLSALRELGFNRLSMGIQDFDHRVQEHVHRIQPLSMVCEVVDAARSLGFPSVNFDLIYGLPFQTLETVRRTLHATVALGPDRIAYYHYAQIPDRIATQRGIDHLALPSSEAKLEMLLAAFDVFLAHGYEFVGLDHFALPDESLAVAAREGSLQRNFQGMAPGAGRDLLGLGVSAISHVLDIGFWQNTHDSDEYGQLVLGGSSPVHLGKRLSADDRIRQFVINQIYCEGRVDVRKVEEDFSIDFSQYFGRELTALHELANDGLIEMNAELVTATFPLGRVLLRNIAAVFDAYIEPDAYCRGARTKFSANA